MRSRDELFRKVERALLEARGATDRRERAAALQGDDTGTAIDDYLGEVRARAYAIGDEDMAAVRAAGNSEDRIFELTVAAAFGESRRRRDKVLALLDEAFAEDRRAS